MGKASINAYFNLYIPTIEPQWFPYHLLVETPLFFYCTLGMLVRLDSIAFSLHSNFLINSSAIPLPEFTKSS